MTLNINYKMHNRCLILNNEIAIISDLHISNATTKSSIERLYQSIQKTLTTHSIKTLILNGDIFTDFPYNNNGIEMLAKLSKNYQLILLEGNHEKHLGGFTDHILDIADNENTTEYTTKIQDLCISVSHGDEISSTRTVDLHIIGHIHPSTIVDDTIHPCLVKVTQSVPKKHTDQIVLITPSYTKTHSHRNNSLPDISHQILSSPLVQTTARYEIDTIC